MRSGIVLAGGLSTRFGGAEKSLMIVDGRRMICRVVDALAGSVDEIIISAREEGQRRRLSQYVENCTFVLDETPDMGIGPLAGIRSGLKAAKGEYVFIAACDMPFINDRVIRLLFEKADGHDAAVPRHENGYVEPLHAAYRRESVLRAVEASISEGGRRVQEPIKRMKDVVFVDDAEIREIDPDLKTFLNINDASEMSRVLEK